MATGFVPSSNKRVPYSAIKAFVEEQLGLDAGNITQMWFGPQGITVHLRMALSQGMLTDLLKDHPGVSLRGDSTHVEAQVSFGIDGEA